MGEIVNQPKKVNEEQDQHARELAENLRRRITEDGEDFGNLAKEYSDDPGSGRFFGDLGVVGRGQFVPEFEAVAYQLEKDEVSEVTKTEYGYHIIQLMERLGNNIHVRHILIRPQILSKDLDLAREQLDSIPHFDISRFYHFRRRGAVVFGR